MLQSNTTPMMNCISPIKWIKVRAVGLPLLLSILWSASAAQATSDYAGAEWSPSPKRNYTVGRSSPISEIVIHSVEDGQYSKEKWPGNFKDAYLTFKNQRTEVSAHYLVSKNGRIVQFVKEQNTAHHILTKPLKAMTIGIEHEGYAGEPYVTESMLRASALLVQDISNRHHIPRDRNHIKGHSEYPRPKKARIKKKYDPEGPNGKNWPWDRYIRYVNDETSPKIHVTDKSGTSIKNRKSTRSKTIKLWVEDGPEGSGLEFVIMEYEGINKNKILLKNKEKFLQNEIFELKDLLPGRIVITAVDSMRNKSSYLVVIKD